MIPNRNLPVDLPYGTLPQILHERCKRTPSEHAFYYLEEGEGSGWKGITWEDFYPMVLKWARVLTHEFQLKPGDAVGILARNSLEWEVVQMAGLYCGLIIVGLDPRDLPEDLEHKIKISKIRCLFTDSLRLLQKISGSLVDSIEAIVLLKDSSESRQQKNGVFSFQEVIDAHGEDQAGPSPFDQLGAPSAVIFTSGTTGRPKGLLYTHEQIVVACKAILRALQVTGGVRSVCWLPMANLFQRMINFCSFMLGGKIFIVEDPRQILHHLPSISPNVFIGVPRFFEKLRDGILMEAQKKGPFQKKAFFLALKLVRDGSLGKKFLKPVLKKTIFRPIQQQMGGSLWYAVSGSAPISMEVLRDLDAMGILCLEAYGISENSVPIAMNRPYAYKFGTVGLPLRENELKIDDDGEILVKGPGVCKAYLTQDGLKAITTTTDGYFRTGDLGILDEDGFLTITGRKNDVFKTSTGRKIVPSKIEERICRIPYVDQCVVFGKNRHCLTAIVTIGSGGEGDDEGTFEERIKEDLRACLADLPPYLQPAGYLILNRAFSMERGEVTPNLKLRRNRIQEAFALELEGLYARIGGSKKEDLPVLSWHNERGLDP